MRKRATLCKWERGINMACLSVSYVCLALARIEESVVLLSPLRHSHSQSTHTKRVNQMLTVMRLATLRACWKIHKTATNITHSHYSLTRSLVYSCRGVLASSHICVAAAPSESLTQFNFSFATYWIHFVVMNMHECSKKYSNVMRVCAWLPLTKHAGYCEYLHWCEYSWHSKAVWLIGPNNRIISSTPLSSGAIIHHLAQSIWLPLSSARVANSLLGCFELGSSWQLFVPPV